MYDSYENQVLCGGRTWQDVRRFSRDGAGPGETRNAFSLVRGPSGSVGVVDVELLRLTLFEPDGQVYATIPAPPMFVPLTHFTDGTISGTYPDFAGGEQALVGELTLDADTMRNKLALAPQSPAAGDKPRFGAAYGTRDAANNLLLFFLGSQYSIERFSPEGRFLGTLINPNYVPETPHETEVERFADDMRRMTGRRPSEAEIRAWAEKPKPPLVGGGLRPGPRSTVWVATTHDRFHASYLDVFREGNFYGRARIRDRILAYDIHGNTLAALVQRSRADASGVRPLAIDWYRITLQ